MKNIGAAIATFLLFAFISYSCANMAYEAPKLSVFEFWWGMWMVISTIASFVGPICVICEEPFDG